MKWVDHAPANIALIKYMGKEDEANNVPSNPSLSYTLDNLSTYVELESYTNSHDIWEPLDIPGFGTFDLPKEGQQRFLNHLDYLKQHFAYEGQFICRSNNNFPSDNGLASSASSFAALTKCAIDAITELKNIEAPSIETIAKLSAHGSGSSCRSFFSPWTLWQNNDIKSVELPYPNLIHHVVIVNHEAKTVPSSEAHRRVITSPHFAGRAERAQGRLKLLLSHFEAKDWLEAHNIVWQEFMDMHQLFETASEPFSYMTDKTKLVLEKLKGFWGKNNDGPLVTMDAGPNIHLLFRPDQQDMAYRMQRGFLVDYDVI